MKNKLGYLGFLGFVGILGLYWGSFTHSIFLIFFFFFSYRNVIPDELFKENIKKSALVSFMVNMIFNIMILLIGSIISNFNHYDEPNMIMIFYTSIAFIINFIISISIFIFSLMYYSYREKRALE